MRWGRILAYARGGGGWGVGGGCVWVGGWGPLFREIRLIWDRAVLSKESNGRMRGEAGFLYGRFFKARSGALLGSA